MFTTTVRVLFRVAANQKERDHSVIEVTRKFLGITFSRTEHFLG